MGPIRCTEMSVNDYHWTLRNTSEERKSDQHRGGSLKSLLNMVYSFIFFDYITFVCVAGKMVMKYVGKNWSLNWTYLCGL
jgi:hypothetical protein